MTALNAGYENNFNIIAIRSGQAVRIHTDRNIDIDGDGDLEKASVSNTIVSANKTKSTISEPSGCARSVVKEATETDGGVTDRDIVFTTGI